MTKGLIELGIFGEIGVAFVDSRIASVAYRGEVGIAIESNAMLYKKDAEVALHSTDVYKTLQGNDIQFKWFYRTGIPVKLLWFGWPNTHKPHDNVFACISLVPNFKDTKLKRDDDNGTTLLASTKVLGICLPVDLGFTLFEQQSTNSVPTSYSRYGYVGGSEDIYASFFDMPTSKKYEVYPTVKLLGIEMLAEPKAEEKGETTCPDANHPHWIDLGLPSSTLWCCCNEGASTPEAYGGYYAFGQVSSAPTADQIKEFLNNTNSVWTTQNGVNGRKFTSKINGGTIFLPAAGGQDWSDRVGSDGHYWSSTPIDPDGAYELDFWSGYASLDPLWCRDYEISVRPVR